MRDADMTPPAPLRVVPPASPLDKSISELEAENDKLRPVVHISTDEHRVTEKAIRALAAEPSVYQRSGRLVHVVRDESKLAGLIRPPNAPRIVAMPSGALRQKLVSAAKWMKHSKQEAMYVPAHPPDWAVQQVADAGEWPGIRPLEAVVETPVIRPDGSVIALRGYDNATGILFEPTATFLPVLDSVDRVAAVAAVNELLDVVKDFPFASPAHRSAWLAGALSPFARYAYSGPTPLFLFDANTRGAGKTLLADTVAMIASGRRMGRMVKPEREEEWTKKVTSLAMAGDSLVLLDNVVGTLGGATLDTVLTGTEWSDRMLGGNEMVRLPLLAIWYATGNNVVLNGDTIRRTCHIRIESPYEKPELREEFEHKDILEWIRRERPRLVRAALTVLRAYCLAGRPDQNLPSWGSFEGWSRIVRHALVWAGQPDPGLTRRELASSSDTEARALTDLLEGLVELGAIAPHEGFTVRAILEKLDDDAEECRRFDRQPNFKRLRDALAELAPPAAGKGFDAKRVGASIRRFKGRIIDGACLDQGGNDRNGVARWVVRRVTSVADKTNAGFAG